MNKLAHIPLAAIAGALAFPLLAPPVQAQDQPTNMPRVEVRRQIPVSTACPNVVQDMSEALGRVAWEIGTPSEVLVDFKLDGDKISDVKASTGHWEFRAPVRRAVRRLACHSPGEGAYTVRFRVVFVYPDDPASAAAAAVLSTDTAAVIAGR